MYRKEITNTVGETWILLSVNPIDDEGSDFSVQMQKGTRTAMNFWGTITMEFRDGVTDEQILAAMMRAEEALQDLLA